MTSLAGIIEDSRIDSKGVSGRIMKTVEIQCKSLLSTTSVRMKPLTKYDVMALIFPLC